MTQPAGTIGFIECPHPVDRGESKIMRNDPGSFDELISVLPSVEPSGMDRPADPAAEMYDAIGYETADLWLRDPLWYEALPDFPNPQDLH